MIMSRCELLFLLCFQILTELLGSVSMHNQGHNHYRVSSSRGNISPVNIQNIENALRHIYNSMKPTSAEHSRNEDHYSNVHISFPSCESFWSFYRDGNEVYGLLKIPGRHYQHNFLKIELSVSRTRVNTNLNFGDCDKILNHVFYIERNFY